MEQAETYLRRLAEAELRHAASAPGFRAARARLRIITDAFTAAGALRPEVAHDIAAGFEDAALARNAPKEPRPASPRPRRVHRAKPLLRPAPAGKAAAGAFPAAPRGLLSADPLTVTPVGAVFPLRTNDAYGRISMLSLLSGTDWALIIVVADGTVRAGADPLPAMHAWLRGMGELGSWRTAIDDMGGEYHLTASAGGGTRGQDVTRPRFSGVLAVDPAPRAGASWLELRGDRHRVRIGLRRQTSPEVAVSPLDLSPAEAHLRRRAESLLGDDAPGDQTLGRIAAIEMLAGIVPAFDTVGALPAGSPAATQFSALCAYLEHSDETALARLPERWASMLPASSPRAVRASRREVTGAAHMPLTFPELDGITVAFAGLINAEGHTTLFGLVSGAPTHDGPAEDKPSLWLRDNTAQWHLVAMGDWTRSGEVMWFEADVMPPLRRSVTSVDVFAAGQSVEFRASVALTWWHDA